MKKLSILVFCLFLAACARDLGANSVVSTDEAGLVTRGTILSVRQVTVKDTDSLGKNGVGIIAGGVVGGIAGSGVGGGSGRGLATAGGAIAGAALGSVIQDELTTSTGLEYIVKLAESNGERQADYRQESRYTVGSDSIKNKLKNTINTPDTETNIISVVQGTDVVLTPGQQVYVIYSNNRVRLVPNY